MCVCVWKPFTGVNVRGRTHVKCVLIPTILLVCGNNVEINTNYGRVCNTIRLKGRIAHFSSEVG